MNLLERNRHKQQQKQETKEKAKTATARQTLSKRCTGDAFEIGTAFLNVVRVGHTHLRLAVNHDTSHQSHSESQTKHRSYPPHSSEDPAASWARSSHAHCIKVLLQNGKEGREPPSSIQIGVHCEKPSSRKRHQGHGHALFVLNTVEPWQPCVRILCRVESTIEASTWSSPRLLSRVQHCGFCLLPFTSSAIHLETDFSWRVGLPSPWVHFSRTIGIALSCRRVILPRWQHSIALVAAKSRSGN